MEFFKVFHSFTLEKLSFLWKKPNFSQIYRFFIEISRVLPLFRGSGQKTRFLRGSQNETILEGRSKNTIFEGRSKKLGFWVSRGKKWFFEGFTKWSKIGFCTNLKKRVNYVKYVFSIKSFYKTSSIIYFLWL